MIGLLLGVFWPFLLLLLISLISSWWRFGRRQSWEADPRGRK